MNRSRYLERDFDKTDRAMLIALGVNARMTVRELAQAMKMSAPSVADRMRRMEDRGIIEGYTIIVGAHAVGMTITALIRIRPMPGEAKRIGVMLSETPEVIEADRVTGDDGFIAKVIVAKMGDLEAMLDRFLPFAAATSSIIQSSLVKRRIPKI